MIDFDKLKKELGLSQKDIAALIDVSPQAINNAKRGMIGVPESWINKLADKLIDVDISNYLINSNPKKKDGTITMERPKRDYNIPTIMREIRELPVVSKLAYASYAENWNDPEYIESMETIPTFQLEDGNYLWFEIKGDSMVNDYGNGIDEGDFLLGRELYKHYWPSLQLRRIKAWVIVHKERGIVVKEIIKQVDSIITCHSWNNMVDDFELNLDDVVQLFYFKELRKTKL